MSDLSPYGYNCLRHAITLARDQQVKTQKALRAKLLDAGHEAAAIDEAMATWAGSVIARLLPDDGRAADGKPD